MYIYKAYQKEKIIYVGITKDIHSRMLSHQNKSKWWGLADRIVFAEAFNQTMSKVYELFYINKYLPIFNTSDKNNDDVSLLTNLPELYFKDIKEYKKKIIKRKPIKSTRVETKNNVSEFLIPDAYFRLRNQLSLRNEKILLLMINNFMVGKNFITYSEIINYFSSHTYEHFIESIKNPVENYDISGLTTIKYINKEKGFYTFKFAEGFEELLTSSNKSTYKIKEINSYKRSGSFRLHFLINRSKKIKLSELKEQFILEKAYKRFFDFEQKFLNIKINDINNVNKLEIRYSKIKKGKFVDEILFK